jgi:hypothetical protein
MTLTNVIYIELSLMQEWSILLKEVDRERVHQVKDEIMSWKKNFQPSLFVPTSIYEI